MTPPIRPPWLAAEVSRTFESLAFRNYRLYFIGQTLSGAGTWMQNIAIGWFTLELTHSGILLGVITAARFAPFVFFGQLGGLVVDRRPLRRHLLQVQIGQAALAFILAMLIYLDLVDVMVLLLMVLAIGTMDVFDVPARHAIIGALVDPPRLGNAIALNSVMINTARVLGPAMAGAAIATVGVAACFFLNALSFVAVIISLALVRVAELLPTPRETGSKGQVRAGLRYVRREPWLRVPLIMVAITGAFTWAYPIALPLVTSGTFNGDASAYGYAMAALGAGSIVGALIAARWPIRSPRGLARSSLLWGLCGLAAAAAPTLMSLYALMVVIGLFAVSFSAGSKTVLQSASAIQMRGRVMSLWFLGWQGSTVIGGPVVGVIGATLGPRWSLVAGGAAAALTGIIYLRRAPGEIPVSPAAPASPTSVVAND
jgi:MFS family permease